MTLSVTHHWLQLNSSEHSSSFYIKEVSCSLLLLHRLIFLCKTSRRACFSLKFSLVRSRSLWLSGVIGFLPFLRPLPGLRSSQSPLHSPPVVMSQTTGRRSHLKAGGAPLGSGAQKALPLSRLRGGCPSPSEHQTRFEISVLTRFPGVPTGRVLMLLTAWGPHFENH